MRFLARLVLRRRWRSFWLPSARSMCGPLSGTEALLDRVQQQQIEAAATRIGLFVQEIETQLGWLTQLPFNAASLDEWHVESVRVLAKSPRSQSLPVSMPRAVEQVRVSRIAVDVVGGQTDFPVIPNLCRQWQASATIRRSISDANRNVSDARHRRRPRRIRRCSCGSESQIHLERDFRNQRRLAGDSVCRRHGWPPHRPSGHEPRPAKYRPIAACLRAKSPLAVTSNFSSPRRGMPRSHRSDGHWDCAVKEAPEKPLAVDPRAPGQSNLSAASCTMGADEVLE